MYGNVSAQSHAHKDNTLKHIEALRARLTFAQFKLNNGWENNSIHDIESLWKKRQRKLINEIPTPRFTQQDIIEKRFHPIKKRSKSFNCSHTPSLPPKIRKQKSDLSSLTSKHIDIYSDSSNENPQAPHYEQLEQAQIRNSLDYLSYAIEISERKINIDF